MAGKTEIGALSVRLTAEAGEFNRAVDRAGIKLHDLARQGSAGFNMRDAAGGIGDAIKAAISDPLAALGKATPLAVPAAAMGGLIATTLSAAESFHTTARRAEELGVSTAAMSGITLAAKDRAAEAEVAIQHLTRTIGEAAGGSKEAQAKFTALGLSWQDLEALSPDAAFGKVNDRIRESATAFEKAAAARAFYGKAGQDNLRLIEEGSAGINAGIATAFKKGLVPDAAFLHSYQEYLAAKRDVMQTLTGFKNAIAINIGGPLLRAMTFFSKSFSAMMEGPDYSGMRGKIQEQQLAALRMADQTKAINGAKAEAAQREAKAVSEALVSAKQMTEQLDKQLKLHEEIAGAMNPQDAADKSRELLAQAMRTPASTKEGDKYQADMYVKYDLSGHRLDRYGRQISQSREYVEQLAKSWRQVAQEQLDVVNKQNLIKRSAELAAQAKSTIADIMSPLQKYQERIGQIDALLHRNKISASQAAAAYIKEIGDREREFGAGGPTNSLERGSQADRSFGLAADAQSSKAKESFEERRKAVEGQMIAAQQGATRAIQALTKVLEERAVYEQEIGGIGP